MSAVPRPDLGPTPMQLRVLEAWVHLGSQKAVARELGITRQTVKNHMGELYVRLGVGGALAALGALGWIRPVAATAGVPCGWLAWCSRPDGHRGQHGGFRPFVRVEA